MFAMVDLKISNLQSVREAFRLIGFNVQMVEDPQTISDADVVILPGVGAFEKGMSNLKAQDLLAPLHEHVMLKKKPIIGFCLGMQLLAEYSTEYGHHKGLGFVRGRVEKLMPTDKRYRVPNMGWCEVSQKNPDSILFKTERAIAPIYYFAHSYHILCDDPQTIAGVIDFDGEVVAAIEQDNIFGLQFHPEKSQTAGLEVLSAFCTHILQQA